MGIWQRIAVTITQTFVGLVQPHTHVCIHTIINRKNTAILLFANFDLHSVSKKYPTFQLVLTSLFIQQF